MKSLRLVSHICMLIALACATVMPSTARAEEDPEGDLVQTIDLPQGTKAKSFRRAAATAAMNRHWVVVSTQDDTVTVRLIHRGKDATVTIKRVGDTAEFYAATYAIRGTGERTARVAINPGWLKNLSTDFRKQLTIESFNTE